MEIGCDADIDEGVGGSLNSRIAKWKGVEEEHRQKQLINPFSEWEGASTRAKLDKDDPNYARPVEGSKTAIRGQQAGQRISGEIRQLVRILQECARRETLADGRVRYAITFGKLFEIYAKISNKLVGILMRARKQGLVQFEGEMLWQRRDDHVVITMLCDVYD
ncbi:actin-binding Rho-activating protein-like [Diadema setosum]|uniref:actin-binding Rho-activating protein-like n=1 Tax=Diadema setosum TaxID=31175 RepID=UPI003B3B3F8B